MKKGIIFTIIFVCVILLAYIFYCFRIYPFNDENILRFVYRTPETSGMAVVLLEQFLGPEELDVFKSMPETEAVDSFQQSIGLLVRKIWLTNAEEKKLGQYFVRLGINYPDDMSAIVLTSLHRSLNGENIDLEHQVGYYTLCRHLKSFNQVTNPEFNRILREILVRDSCSALEGPQINSVIVETIPVCLRSLQNNDPELPRFGVPPGPDIYYPEDFENLVKKGLLSEMESQQMCNSIDCSKVFVIDSTLILKSTFSFLDEYKLRMESHRSTNDKSQTELKRGYIYFSTPLFNQDSTKMMMTVSKYWSFFDGHGTTYIFQKINGKWEAIGSIGGWES